MLEALSLAKIFLIGNNMKTWRTKRERGFTLIIAVLVASLLLAIGFSLANFAVKQLIISSTGRESQFAFYAADSGIECAFYWDFKYGVSSAFATSSSSQTPAIVCNGQTIQPVVTASSATDASSTFAFNFAPQPYCTVVSVGKQSDGSTIIESRGYNSGTVIGPNCTDSNPRRVERALRVRY